MSYLTELLRGKLTFSQAADKAGAWASALVAKDPALAQAAGAALSVAKQAASDAIMLADTELGAHIMPAAVAVETALDAALASATGGLSMPFNPLVNGAIDQMARLVKQAADAWALEQKAKLANPAA